MARSIFLLEEFVQSQHQDKKVIFLDEFPWLDSRKSNFLEAFSYFWNNFCTKRDDVIVIACGSSATYMIDKFIKNKNTLHSRDTLRLNMQQFDLLTSKKLLQLKGCNYTDKSIVECLEKAAKVIVTYSSVGHEAYLLDIPVEVIRLPGKIDESPLGDLS